MTNNVIEYVDKKYFSLILLVFVSLCDFFWLFLKKFKYMICIKNTYEIEKMMEAGKRLAIIFQHLHHVVVAGATTLEIDQWIQNSLQEYNLKTTMKGYRGYGYVSCISINDEVVHGVPKKDKIIQENDLVKVDVCASFDGYCADMARPFFIGKASTVVQEFMDMTKKALEAGIFAARAGNHVSDISSAVGQVLLSCNYGIIRDFAGHGIGKNMHEDPDVFNYGKPKRGPILRPGMALAIEPMATLGKDAVWIEEDGWTVRTRDKSLAMHIEDTIIITENDPQVTTYNAIR